jgi:hypothetical protein
MLPGMFVDMESFPKTPNGKLDRKALPAPDSAREHTQAYEAPHGEREETLARIWQELFGLEGLGRFGCRLDLVDLAIHFRPAEEAAPCLVQRNAPALSWRPAAAAPKPTLACSAFRKR